MWFCSNVTFTMEFTVTILFKTVSHILAPQHTALRVIFSVALIFQHIGKFPYFLTFIVHGIFPHC